MVEVVQLTLKEALAKTQQKTEELPKLAVEVAPGVIRLPDGRLQLFDERNRKNVRLTWPELSASPRRTR